jgi:hypothetical protein
MKNIIKKVNRKSMLIRASGRSSDLLLLLLVMVAYITVVIAI